MPESLEEDWRRYGRSIIVSMQEVLAASPEPLHDLLLETADYWLSLGLAIGLRRAAEAEALLGLIHAQDVAERDELDVDADSFCAEVLE